MPARPFARPAFDTQIPEMLTILKDALWRELVGVTVVDAPTLPSAPGGGGLV
jgi:hypothetical protein